jgi:hypothetical protein
MSRRKAKSEKRKAKSEKRKAKSEKRKAKSEKRKAGPSAALGMTMARALVVAMAGALVMASDISRGVPGLRRFGGYDYS